MLFLQFKNRTIFPDYQMFFKKNPDVDTPGLYDCLPYEKPKID